MNRLLGKRCMSHTIAGDEFKTKLNEYFVGRRQKIEKIFNYLA